MKEARAPSLLMFILILLFNNSSYAQNGIVSAGGGSSSSGGNIHYSVGQPDYLHYSQQGFSINEGIQQPHEISEILAYKDIPDLLLNIWPNPFTSFLNIEMAGKKNYQFFFSISDITGQVQLKGMIEDKILLQTNNLLPGVYLFTISDNNNFQKTYKLIKQ